MWWVNGREGVKVCVLRGCEAEKSIRWVVGDVVKDAFFSSRDVFSFGHRWGSMYQKGVSVC